MNEAAFRADQIKVLKSAENGGVAHNAIITGTPLEDGNYHVLSRYGDPYWRLPNTLFPAGELDANKILNFDNVPSGFRETLRVCMALYMLAGIEGRPRPRGTTITKVFSNAVSFVTWLAAQGIERLSNVSPLIAQQYVDFCRTQPGRKNKSLSSSALVGRFLAVELLQMLSAATADAMPHPWPDASASHLAGLTGQNAPTRNKAKTDIIPDQVLGPLFQSAAGWLERADDILDRRDQIERWQAEGRCFGYIDRQLRRVGWTKGEAINAVRHLHSASMVIILITSGIRVSELCSLETGSAYSCEADYGDRYHWIRGISYKTGVGPCEWLVPKITHRAIAVAERVVEPLQARLLESVGVLRSNSPNDPDITRFTEHAKRLFLRDDQRRSMPIATISKKNVIDRLNKFADSCELDWRFAPHQFRRTFAVYAAHSVFGDLRYLRDHFKHWSLDMTGLYAMNREQDEELYDEVGLAALGIKTELLEHWLEKDALLSGGASDQIRTFRENNEEMRTHADRAEMAVSVSRLVNIRATGVAWCTADTEGCDGGQGLEKTRCGDCGKAVIDISKKPVWRGIYAQQVELRQLPDIGPGGRERVERDIKRCRKVLRELGATEHELDDVTT